MNLQFMKVDVTVQFVYTSDMTTLSTKRSRPAYMGTMQRAALDCLDHTWQTVSDTCAAVRVTLGDPGLNRMRVSNALRGLRERGLIAARRAGVGDKAAWLHRLKPEVATEVSAAAPSATSG